MSIPTPPKRIADERPVFPCELYYPGDKNTEAFWSPTLHKETWRLGMPGFTHWRPPAPSHAPESTPAAGPAGEAELATLRTLVAKQREALGKCEHLADPNAERATFNAIRSVANAALAPTPAHIADELANSEAEVGRLRAQLASEWTDCAQLVQCALEGRECKAYSDILDKQIQAVVALRAQLTAAESRLAKAAKDTALLDAFEAIRADDVHARQISEDECEQELVGHFWQTISVQSTDLRVAMQATIEAARTDGGTQT